MTGVTGSLGLLNHVGGTKITLKYHGHSGEIAPGAHHEYRGRMWDCSGLIRTRRDNWSRPAE